MVICDVMKLYFCGFSCILNVGVRSYVGYMDFIICVVLMKIKIVINLMVCIGIKVEFGVYYIYIGVVKICFLGI